MLAELNPHPPNRQTPPFSMPPESEYLRILRSSFHPASFTPSVPLHIFSPMPPPIRRFFVYKYGDPVPLPIASVHIHTQHEKEMWRALNRSFYTFARLLGFGEKSNRLASSRTRQMKPQLRHGLKRKMTNSLDCSKSPASPLLWMTALVVTFHSRFPVGARIRNTGAKRGWLNIGCQCLGHAQTLAPACLCAVNE